MKNISTILMAALIVLSSFAFTKAVKHRNDDVVLWELKAGADASQPSSYQKATGSIACSGTGYTCTIMDVQSSSNENEPALTYGTPSNSNSSSYSRVQRSNP